MAIAEQIKTDLTGAMRAGEKEKVGALRLVLSELQKAAKEGNDDEQAILRRERKRRLESAAAFRDAGRAELAEGEESEAAVIQAYLPAELGDDELKAIVADAISETGASSALSRDVRSRRLQSVVHEQRCRQRQAGSHDRHEGG